MSAQSYEPLPRRGAAIPCDPASVYAALPENHAAEFRAQWETALDQARDDLDLTALTARLTQVTGEYWAVASALASPRAAQAREDGRRWLAGEDIGAIPADQLPRRLR